MTRNLPDKLIRRIIYIKSIKFMQKKFYDMDYHMHTDDTIFFGIIRFAELYGFLEQIGYFYNQDPKRNANILIKKDKSTIINENIQSLFNIMKYLFVQSDNNTIEKNSIAYKFFKEKVKNYISNNINSIINNFEFYVEVLDLYINCPFFTRIQKDEFNKIKDKIINQKKTIHNIKTTYNKIIR